MGYTAFVDAAGNAVGKRGNGPNEIMLLGHIDTVPGFIEVRREEDALYGRGSVDAKGSLASFVTAAAAVPVPPNWRLTVIGAVGEESASHGASFVCDHYRPHMLIIGEPSKWERITLGFKGSLWVSYLIQQPMSHTASAEPSACEIAIQFWNEAKAWCTSLSPQDAGAFYQLTPSLRGMDSTNDGFIETAHMRLNFRLPPGVTIAQVKDKLCALRQAGELTFGDGDPAYRAEKNTPLVRSFLNAIRSTGGTPTFSLKTGTSDMNLVTPSWGCPAVAYGPGDSSLDHTPHEHLMIAEYQRSIVVLQKVLGQLMSANTVEESELCSLARRLRWRGIKFCSLARRLRWERAG